MSLQIPSGLIVGVSGGGVTSGTTGPVIAYPIPVVIVGAHGASASGNDTITDSSGSLNVNIQSGVAVSISGNIVLVTSGGTVVVQTSGSPPNVVIAVSGQTALLNDALLDGFGGAFGALQVGAFTRGFDGTNWDKMRSAIGASGMAAGSGEILAAAITAVSPGGSGQFMPLNATSGILSVGTSGSANVVIAGSGGVAASTESNGALLTILRGDTANGEGNNAIRIAAFFNADGQTIAGNATLLGANGVLLFNGTNLDRIRSVPGSSGASTGILATQTVGYSYKNTTGAAITNVFSGAAYLHAININQYSSGGQFQIRDATSGVAGTLIGTVSPDVGSVTNAALPPVCFIYDCLVTSGIVISSSGANWDLTVLYRTA